jgi:hypothetical protein
MSFMRFGLVLGGCLFACLAARAGLKDDVAVSSVASGEFIRPTDSEGKPLPCSYVFSEGKYLSGGAKDVHLEKSKFMDIAKGLAVSLSKQNFWPATPPDKANLLLVVHWGSTFVMQDPSKDLAIERMNQALGEYNQAIEASKLNPTDSGMADPGDLNWKADQFAFGQDIRSQAVAQNAVLLGYASTLRKLGVSNLRLTQKAQELREELSEERYFVVVMAYDYQLFKQKKSKLLWVSRMSVSTVGNNFPQAVSMMSEAGAAVFGQSTNGLAYVPTKIRNGEVSIGKPIAIEVEEDKSAK